MIDDLTEVYVFVDCQKDFIYEDRKLPVPGAEELLGTLGELSKLKGKAITTPAPRIYTADWHNKNDEELDEEDPDFVNTFPPHCMEYTEGAEIVSDIKPKSCFHIPDSVRDNSTLESWQWILRNNEDILFRKNRFNLFEGNQYAHSFFRFLDSKTNMEKLHVAGVSGNVCVKQFVEGVLSRVDAEIIVHEDCIRSLPAEGPLEEEGEMLDRWKNEGLTIT